MLHLVLFSILAGMSSEASAYIGFGPGMTMIGAFFSLLLVLLAALVMVVILPIRSLLARRRERKHQKPPAQKSPVDDHP